MNPVVTLASYSGLSKMNLKNTVKNVFTPIGPTIDL